MTENPAIPYWHLYTDADGVSRFARCAMDQLEWKSLSSSAQWQGQKRSGVVDVMFSVLPPGWFGDWHENPKPQWIIPLSGRWYVEAMDGTRLEFGPGDAHFGEDQGTAERNGRKGHMSGTVGNEPCAQMIVQYNDPPTRNSPCRFR